MIRFIFPAILSLAFGSVPILAETTAPAHPASAQTTSGLKSAASEKVHHSTSWGEKLKQGGNTALVQIGLSIFGAGFVFERLFRLRRRNLVPVGLSDRARNLWAKGDFDSLEKLGETEPSTLARAISFIAKNRRAPMADVSEVCGELVSRELAEHSHRAYPLGIIASIAPLLGLLGMILGMIETFETVSLAGSLGDASQLAGGISESLVTTGLGIAVAIPFLATYHFFKHRTAGFGGRLEEEVTSLLTAWLMKSE